MCRGGSVCPHTQLAVLFLKDRDSHLICRSLSSPGECPSDLQRMSREPTAHGGGRAGCACEAIRSNTELCLNRKALPP